MSETTENKQSNNNCKNQVEQLILVATSIAITLSKGKTDTELETIINLLEAIKNILAYNLAQREIYNKQGGFVYSLDNFLY